MVTPGLTDADFEEIERKLQMSYITGIYDSRLMDENRQEQLAKLLILQTRQRNFAQQLRDELRAFSLATNLQCPVFDEKMQTKYYNYSALNPLTLAKAIGFLTGNFNVR